MSPLFSLGVDCSTHTTAMVVLDHTGYHAHKLVHHPKDVNGFRRLMLMRSAVMAVLDDARWDLDVAAIEVPRTITRLPGGKVRVSGFDLESCAAVVGECIQARYPHLVVLQPTPSEWQADTIGSGKDAKARSLAHARANGFDTTDDNLSDGYGIAEYARELYIRDVLKEVA